MEFGLELDENWIGIGRDLKENNARTGYDSNENWLRTERPIDGWRRTGILIVGFTLRDCNSMYARSAYGCLVLYTIFDASVRENRLFCRKKSRAGIAS